MAMTWVLRFGSVACRDGRLGEIGVVEKGVGDGAGSDWRYSLYVRVFFSG
jgi:hypothetical protein